MQFYRIFWRFELSSSQFDREQLTSLLHFPVIGECLGWRTTDFEELYGDLGQWTMTKELAREVSCFYSSNHCEVWWIAESILNMSRSRADGTMSSWLLYFRNFTNFHTVSYVIWTPLWAKCASAPAILSNIPANGPSEIWSYFLSLKTIRAASFELFVICQCCYCWYCSRRLSNTIIC